LNLFAAWTNLQPSTDVDSMVPYRVFPSFLNPSPDQPFFSTFFALGGGESDNDTTEDVGLTSVQAKKLNATTETTIRLPLEGFNSTVSCQDVQGQVNVTSDLITDADLTRYELNFPCGTRRLFYPRNGAFAMAVDAFACHDGTPQVFVFGLNTTTGDVLFLERCDVETNSATFPVAIRFGGAQGFPNVTLQGAQDGGALPLPSSDVVQLLGSAILNGFGSSGWSDLATWLQDPFPDGSRSSFDSARRRTFLETVLSTITKATLCNFATFLSLNQVELGDLVNSTDVGSEVRPPSALLSSRTDSAP
jgi:hypothetical protein